MILASIIAVVFAIYVLFKIHALERKNDALQVTVRELKKRLPGANGLTPANAIPLSEDTTTASTPSASPQSASITSIVKIAEEPVVLPHVDKTVEQDPQPGFIQWILNARVVKSLERKFSENWTGFIGAILLVLGIGFLSVYTALKMSPSYRFLLVCAVSAGLASSSLYFKRKDFWQFLTQWMRSSAAGLFLFACIGASTIPAIKWIHHLPLALFFLMLGILVNLLTGFLSRKEFFAATHTFFGLLALSIGLPAVDNSAAFPVVFLGIAAVITIASIMWGRKEKWEYNTLISVSSFSLFHLFWSLLIGTEAYPFFQQLTGISSVIFICLAALLVHYSKLYSTATFQRKPFWVHVICWTWLGIGLVQYYTPSPWATLGLVSAALGAFFMAMQAKKLGVRWLYVTDSLIAQGLAVIAVFTLFNLDASYSLVFNLIFCLLTLFSVIRVMENDRPLARITDSALILAGFSNLLFHLSVSRELAWSTVLFIAATSAGIAAHAFLLRRTTERSEYAIPYLGQGISVYGIILGASLVVGYLLFQRLGISMAYLLLLAVPLLFIRQRIQGNGFSLGLVLSIFFISIHHWDGLLRAGSIDIQSILIPTGTLAMIFLAASFLSYVKDKNRHYSFFGIYLLGVHLLLSIYLIGKWSVPFTTGVIFLLTSLVLLELAGIIQKRFHHSGNYILHMAYLFVFAFVIRHLSMELYLEELWGMFEARSLIQLFAVIVFLYWVFARRYKQDVPDLSWEFIHPFFIELTLVFITLFAYSNTSGNMLGLYWIMLAFFALYLGHNNWLNAQRLKLYAYVFYLISIFQVTFVSSHYVSPSLKLFDQTWVRSMVSIVGQAGFLGYALKALSFKNTEPLKIFQWVPAFGELIESRKNLFLFYPMFICLALFLYWSFDNSVLTLLWLTEAFGVFVLSILLTSNHFRLVSIASVGVCLLRIVFFDLTGTSTITRAIVFIGAGVILILMNSIYNKYKDRFQEVAG